VSPGTPQAGTLGPTLDRAAQRLATAGISRARPEAELIAAHVLGRPREWVLIHGEAELSPADADQIAALVARRARREPLAYVLGHVEFYSLDFLTTPAAIVPRPETELLVEVAAARARAMRARFAVDVGTGCGAIAVALAREVSGLRLAATDVSREALALARRNCERHGVADRVALICCDLMCALGRPADCVVANLPYVRADEFAGLDPEVRDYEPRLALDGGPDGLAAIQRLAVSLRTHLRKGGFAALEVGAGQAGQVAKLLSARGLSRIDTVADHAGVPRVVIGQREEPG